MTLNRLPFLLLMGLGLVIVVVVGLATGSWVVFGIALAVHLIASAAVLTGAFRTAQGGPEADARSQRLNREAGEASGGAPGDVEAELEALKRRPADQ